MPPRSEACRHGSGSLPHRPQPRLPSVSASARRRRRAPTEPPAVDTCNGAHRADARSILGRSPPDGAAPWLDVAPQRRLDLRSQRFRQPPVRLAEESADVRTRRGDGDLLHSAVNLHADALLSLSARASSTFHKCRSHPTHPPTPVDARQANNLSGRNALLVRRRNPHHAGPARERARAHADELRRDAQRRVCLHRQLGLQVPDSWLRADRTRRPSASSCDILRLHAHNYNNDRNTRNTRSREPVQAYRKLREAAQWWRTNRV